MVAANVIDRMWMVPLPFGFAVPAGVFFFAPLFTLRDRIQFDRGARYVYALIALTGVLGWLTGLATGLSLFARVSLAGLAAFVISEALETVVFSAINKPFVPRSLIANIIAALVDSIVFISLAFGFQSRIILGQWIIKIIISTLVIPLVKPKPKVSTPV